MFIPHEFRSAVHASRRDELGASLVEYAMLMALIAMICISAVTMLGGSASGSVDDLNDGFQGCNEQGWGGFPRGSEGELAAGTIDDPPTEPGPCTEIVVVQTPS